MTPTPAAGPKFVTLPEIRRAAREKLPRDHWNFGDGAAETESTKRRNRRHLGRLVLFNPEGDVEMARGAGQGQTLQWLSGATGWPVEAVAKAASGPQMFQLYAHGDHGWM